MPDPAPTPNPFAQSDIRQKHRDLTKRLVIQVFTYFIIGCTFVIFGDIIRKGAPVIFPWAEGEIFNGDFLVKMPGTLVSFEDENGDIQRMDIAEFRDYTEQNPDAVLTNEHRHSYCGGGIWGPLVGTILLVSICIFFALIIGISTAIYLNEYSDKGKFVNAIRLAILNLAGVPSIVFGLFGLGFFCYAFPVFTSELSQRSIFAIQLGEKLWLSAQGFGTSMMAGGLTLAVMILPVIITACEEALRAVPMGFREASLALGATKWQTIRKAVLPYAFGGILTSSVLGITRVAGETAPIMFTAALAHKDKLPWEDLQASGLGKFGEFFYQSVQAMPYHIYTVAARIPQSEFTRPMQYGSVFIFMIIVILMATLSIILRARFRNKLKW